MSSSKHSPLDPASERLALAFERLESAISTQQKTTANTLNEAGWLQRLDDLESDLSSAHEELDSLRDENAALRSQLQELQQDYLELQSAARNTADAIERKAEQLELMA